MKSFIVKILLFNLFLFSGTALILPQEKTQTKETGRITGTAIDGATEQPIEGANFVLTLLSDTTKKIGCATNGQGKILITNIPFGSYSARISHIGYKLRNRKLIVLSAAGPELRLDTIRLKIRTVLTPEAQIVADKERVIKETDRYIIRAGRELGINAFDMLDNAPMVNVDMDDNISVMGLNAIIYINGMPSGFSGISRFKELKIYSYNEVEKFEIITESIPGFEVPNGSAIINIITKKISDVKYDGIVEAEANTNNRFEENVNINALSPESIWKAFYTRDDSRINGNSSSIKTLAYEGEVRNISMGNDYANRLSADKIMLNNSFKPEKNSAMGITINYNLANTKKDGTNSNSITGANGLAVSNSGNDIKTDIVQRFFNVASIFNYNLDGPKSLLNAGFIYTDNKMTADNKIYRYSEYFTPSGFSNQYQTNSNTINTNRQYSFNTGTSGFYGKTMRYSAMITADYLNLKMDNHYYDYNNELSRFIERGDQEILQNNDELRNRIVAIAVWPAKWFNMNIMLAADLKKTWMKDDARNYSYNNSFSSFAPAVTIKRKIWPDFEMGLSYAGNTSYPLNKQLSPYSDISDSTNIITGNPYLSPSKTDAFSLTYSYNAVGALLSGALEYRKQSDIIEAVTTVENPVMTRTTYMNLADSKNYSFRITGDKTFFSRLNINATLKAGNINYNGMASSYNGTNFNAFVKSSLKLNIMKLYFDMNYSSVNYTSQVKTDPVFYANIAVRQLFFDKNLSVTLKVADVFNSLRNKTNTAGSGFQFVNNSHQTTRYIKLDVSWFFYSKAQEEIPEDKKEQYDDDF